MPRTDHWVTWLGLTQSAGLLDLALAPQTDALALLHPTEIGTLSVLPVGQQRGERPELFASDQMVRAMQNLGRRFSDRLIILDVSPCLSTSDPATLAPVVGQILFVIEAERTQRDEVEASLDLIQTCPTITLLLNKVQMSTPRSSACILTPIHHDCKSAGRREWQPETRRIAAAGLRWWRACCVFWQARGQDWHRPRLNCPDPSGFRATEPRQIRSPERSGAATTTEFQIPDKPRAGRGRRSGSRLPRGAADQRIRGVQRQHIPDPERPAIRFHNAAIARRCDQRRYTAAQSQAQL